MKVGVIGYGSIGKVVLEKLARSGAVAREDLYVSNRTYEKIAHLGDLCRVCRSSGALAAETDVIFLCVRPADIRAVLEEIGPAVREDALLVSLNECVSFASMSRIFPHKMAKAIPNVAAEIGQSQTLVCYNALAGEGDRAALGGLLGCLGSVIELPEEELAMGSELVSCMPGFLGALFDALGRAAGERTSIPEGQILEMLLGSLSGTAALMRERGLSFVDVAARVATRGGMTEAGAAVLAERFPAVAGEMFDRTTRRYEEIARRAQADFQR